VAQSELDEAGWGEQSRNEPRWPASLAVALAIALYVVLPPQLLVSIGPRWLIPALEAALVVTLTLVSPRRMSAEVTALRVASIVLIALINLANAVSLAELIRALLAGSGPGGRKLVYSSVPIWLTNVLVFALWYWELDRGGPAARLQRHHREPDFLFPQMANPQAARPGWSPKFLDYLYTSFTNATAFSPTDTMPLTA